jgi:hypothetical protein
MHARKWRNWLIGFLLAAALYAALAYVLVDFVADRFIEQVVPEVATLDEILTNIGNEATEDTGDATSDTTSPKEAATDDSGTTDKSSATAIQDQLTLEEKMTITSILASKFSSEEMDLFTRLSAGGLTNAEKKQMRELFLRKLTETEYNELIAIAAKYGLSEGKTYREQTN